MMLKNTEQQSILLNRLLRMHIRMILCSALWGFWAGTVIVILCQKAHLAFREAVTISVGLDFLVYFFLLGTPFSFNVFKYLLPISMSLLGAELYGIIGMAIGYAGAFLLRIIGDIRRFNLMVEITGHVPDPSIYQPWRDIIWRPLVGFLVTCILIAFSLATYGVNWNNIGTGEFISLINPFGVNGPSQLPIFCLFWNLSRQLGESAIDILTTPAFWSKGRKTTKRWGIRKLTEVKVNIFVCGKDDYVCQFAEQIKDSISTYAKVDILDVDELERFDREGRWRPEEFEGTGVYVLSPSMLKPDYQWKLLSAIPRIGPFSLAFYICCGITIQEIKDRYPKLKVLMDKIMIGEEDTLPVLQKEIQIYFDKLKTGALQRERIRLILCSFPKLILGMVITFLGNIALLLFYLGFITPIALVCLLVIPGLDHRLIEVTASLLSLYSIGFFLNSLPAFDIGPWLGPKWKLAKESHNWSSNSYRTSEEAISWLPEVCYSQKLLDASCSTSFLNDVLTDWWRFATRVRLWVAVQLIYLSAVPLIILTQSPTSVLLLGSLSLFCGIMFPVLYYWGTNSVRRITYWEFGLTDQEIQRGDRYWNRKESPVPRHNGDTHNYGKKLMERPLQLRDESDMSSLQMEGWVQLQTASSFGTRRSWSKQSHRVFISHAWKDDNAQSHPIVAERLEETLDKLGIPAFLDLSDNPNKFSIWRMKISEALLDCTHFFIIIGPEVCKGEVILREVKTTLVRWCTELFPTIIVVTEDDTVDKLLSDKNLPLEFRFILLSCPRLTYAEASDLKKVAYLIQQRSRQGLFRDWKAVLFAKTTLRQWLEKQSALSKY